MSLTVFKVVFDDVYISSTISLIWRIKLPISSYELMKINFLCLLYPSKLANFEEKIYKVKGSEVKDKWIKKR